MMQLDTNKIAAFKKLGFTDDTIIELIESSMSRHYIATAVAQKEKAMEALRYKVIDPTQPTAPSPKLAAFTQALMALDPAAQNALLDQCLAAAQQAAQAAPKTARKMAQSQTPALDQWIDQALFGGNRGGWNPFN